MIYRIPMRTWYVILYVLGIIVVAEATILGTDLRRDAERSQQRPASVEPYDPAPPKQAVGPAIPAVADDPAPAKPQPTATPAKRGPKTVAVTSTPDPKPRAVPVAGEDPEPVPEQQPPPDPVPADDPPVEQPGGGEWCTENCEGDEPLETEPQQPAPGEDPVIVE